jgi:hypothetical protein
MLWVAWSLLKNLEDINKEYVYFCFLFFRFYYRFGVIEFHKMSELSSASSDLNVLDSMGFGTVSFKELLGHCNEVYKKNQSDLARLQNRLQSFGFHIPSNSRSFPVFSLITEKKKCQKLKLFNVWNLI